MHPKWYRWILTRDGRWQLKWPYTSLASGQIEGFNPVKWHPLRLEMKGDRLSGAVDGKPLAAVTDDHAPTAWRASPARMIAISSTTCAWIHFRPQAKPSLNARDLLPVEPPCVIKAN
jgi:hypothetical protein